MPASGQNTGQICTGGQKLPAFPPWQSQNSLQFTCLLTLCGLDVFQKGTAMTLRISLKDGERMIVNGAVIKARGRLSLEVESEACLLRGRDVMSPDDATTPARRLYYVAMLAYVDAPEREKHLDMAVELVADIVSALANPDAIACAIEAAQKLASGQYYKALSDCRWLIAYEDRVLGHAEAASLGEFYPEPVA